MQNPAKDPPTKPRQASRTSGLRLPSFLLLVPVCFLAVLTFFPGAALPAKGKPVSWKVIDDALLRVNGSAVKDWSVSQSGKKSDPLLLKMGSRFLLIEVHDRRVFEIDPKTVEQKADDLLWPPSDRPAQPLATSAWDTEDLGSTFRIALKLDAEDRSFDLQLSHPPDVGDLPTHPAGSNNANRRSYAPNPYSPNPNP